MKKLLFCLAATISLTASYAQDATSKLKVGSRDEFTNKTTFTHKKVPLVTWAKIAAYIVVDDVLQRPTLIVKYKYAGNDWIFFNKISLKYTDTEGDHFKEIEFLPSRKNETVLSGGGVVESVKTVPSEDDIQFIKQMTLSNNVILRCEGKYYNNYKVTKQELIPLKEMLEAFDSMKNQSSQSVN